MHHFDTIYPFSAIVGQDLMKKALLLNAINPGVGGVLIRGEKGTAKSTAARALAHLLPEREVVDGCIFGCDPADVHNLCSDCRDTAGNLITKTSRVRVIELPLCATEDKVVGSLDIEHALQKGERKFEPGVLAQAHRNILYVDEVNLLNDHIVDVLLDAAAMGVNIVEREGVSYVHPASFILIGTMNPEEGDLRPQLLDRFGLCVDIVGIDDPETRVEVIRRRWMYENYPETFIAGWAEQETITRDSIVQAQELLSAVSIPDEMVLMIAQVCIDAAVDGHRADIIMTRTSKTIAAYHGRTEVEEEDINEAAELVLAHRMRSPPPPAEQPDKDKQQQSEQKPQKQPEQQQQQEEQKEQEQKERENTVPDGSITTMFAEGSAFKVNQRSLYIPRRMDSFKREGSGRRSVTESRDGKYVRSRIPKQVTADIALDATIRAAAPYQKGRTGDLAVQIEPADIREKVRERKMGNTVLFVVDASGSMGAQQRMTAVKGAILSLLIDAYQKRDRVGLVVFRGSSAEVLLPPTSSVELARKCMQALPVGGKTPLAHGLSKGFEVLAREKLINVHSIPRLILISDGKANVGLGSSSPLDDAKEIASRIKESGISALVIDTEKSYIAFGLARVLSDEMGARYLKLEDLEAGQIAELVKAKGM